MTENKQFKLQTDIVGNCFIAGEDCTFGMFTKLERKQVISVINKMNELYEEKESWRKSWIEEMGDQEEQSKCILKLVKGNEKLKSTIKEVTELLSDEVDLFSDKATEHDINAYVELKELDNKDAYYMATATKKAIQMLKELQE